MQSLFPKCISSACRCCVVVDKDCLVISGLIDCFNLSFNFPQSQSLKKKYSQGQIKTHDFMSNRLPVQNIIL